MKTFELISVEYQNIMSVGDKPISVDLNSHHKTLITGTNGTGKSTMLEAITFALFGKTFRDIKLTQLINSTTKKKLLVKLIMKYDGSVYEIHRGQKPTVFDIIKDGVALDANASSVEFQSQFEEMIGMNYNSFKQVVVLGTAGYTPFMGLKTPERRKLVEDLLEVTILAEMDKANKALIKQINTDLQTNSINVNHVKSQIATHVEYAEKQKKLSGDNVDRLKAMFNECVAKITSIRDANLALTERGAQIVVSDFDQNQIQKVQSSVVESQTKLTQYNRVLTLYSNGGSCPTCYQQLNDTSLTNKIETSANELKVQIETNNASLEQLRAEKASYDETQRQLNAINSEIATNKQMAVNEAERAKKIKLAIAESEKEFIDNSDQIADLEKQLANLMDEQSKMMVERHRRTYIVEMLKDSGIKSSIIRDYIPVFNKQINYYLNIMEADYSFTLNEEFKESVKSRGRETFTYTSFSQGEKARIDLALLFTWRDVAEKISGIRINCLFLDEVADGSTDVQGVKTIQQILNDKKGSNVFIISHRDHNPEDYGQHLHMRKVGRFTVLNE